MLRTIMLGSCVSVQGIVVGQKPDGRLIIKVGDRVFVGPAVLPAGKTALTPA